MTLITDRQREIIKFIREHPNDEVKLNEIVKKFQHWYYCNGRKHVSDIVFRMLKSGKLLKPKHGYYKLNENPVFFKPDDTPIDPDQINIFDQGA